MRLPNSSLVSGISPLSFVVAIALTVSGQSPRNKNVSPPNNSPSQNTRAAREVLVQAKSAALKIRGDFQRGEVLDEIGAAEAKAGLLDMAVLTANRAYPHSLETMKALGEELGDSNDLSRAQALGRRLKGGNASSLFGFMARRQAEKGNIEGALGTTKFIRAPEVRSYALEGIAEQQSAKGDYEAARKTLDLAKAVDSNARSARFDMGLMIVIEHVSRGDVEGAKARISAMKSFESKVSAMIAVAESLQRSGATTAPATWVEDAIRILPPGSQYDIWRYLTIPLQVRVGQQNRAMQVVAELPPGFRSNGYVAIAVTCAELKDVACVSVNLEKMKSAAKLDGESETSIDFKVQLDVLNVAAALIESGEFEAASGLLDTIEQLIDDTNVSSTMSIEPNAQLQRVFMLARQDRFADARLLALKIKENSVSDVHRGKALCTVALLETKKSGVAVARRWVSELTDTEDRAYGFLGLAQGLLGYPNPKLAYSAIRIH